MIKDILGLHRVKKTVNFDAPEIYHLYYGGEVGILGSVTTNFPYGEIPHGKRWVGEVGVTEFAVLKGSPGYWEIKLSDRGVSQLTEDTFSGEGRLTFDGPDGEGSSWSKVKRAAASLGRERTFRASI